MKTSPEFREAVCAYRHGERWWIPRPTKANELAVVVRAKGVVADLAFDRPRRAPVARQTAPKVPHKTNDVSFPRPDPASQPSIGKAVFRKLGWGSRSRERELDVLALALFIHRARDAEGARGDQSHSDADLCFLARRIAHEFRCSVEKVPLHFRQHLEMEKLRNEEWNAPQNALLRQHGLTARAKALLKGNPHGTLVLYFGSKRARLFPLTRRKQSRWRTAYVGQAYIQLRTVRTAKQIDDLCVRLGQAWPSAEEFGQARASVTLTWKRMNLVRAAIKLAQQGKAVTPENLLPLLYSNIAAEKSGRLGISIRTFRARYNLENVRDARRAAGVELPTPVKVGKAVRPNDDEVGIDYEEHQGLKGRSGTVKDEISPIGREAVLDWIRDTPTGERTLLWRKMIEALAKDYGIKRAECLECLSGERK